MGVTKIESYTNAQNQMANLLKAMAHPARLAILEHLLKVNACICGDLVQELPLAQPTVSQHLKELKNAGLIKGTISGNSICYCIDEKAIEILKTYVFDMANTLIQRKNTCC